MENMKLTCNRLITILDRNGIKVNNSSTIDMILDNYDIMDVKITNIISIVKVSLDRPGQVFCGGDPDSPELISNNKYIVEFIDDCGVVYTCLLEDKYNIGERTQSGYPMSPFYRLCTPEHHIGLIVKTFEGKTVLSESLKKQRRNAYKKILKEKQEKEILEEKRKQTKRKKYTITKRKRRTTL